MLRKLHIIAITLVLLFLLCIPLSVLLYAVNPLLGGLVLLAPLITLQVLSLKALQSRFPPAQHSSQEARPVHIEDSATPSQDPSH
jgi:hypothetical protein